ncbi:MULTISPECIES: hypothetical protein [Photobacterium]|uniref:Uncharacterized protein n=1 Tax=Photobacterium leiognathi subsp. mandapamensis TaxID=48408 RepID=A0A2T3KSD7_PHOLD|nr:MULTISPECIES: hypothetical protein [Photobacterium]NVO75332.1 hypothetical protein [Photobacterium damselae subsp. damselae]PSV09343.1 hypothetical protein C0W93_15185 [Photobacterium leiognathi subsp. mandapamensis]SPY25004.1 Uncharacterised protein [Photobacterium damselae]
MKLNVGELKKMLELYSDDTEIYFSGLDFYRLKNRGDKLVQVEFNQLVYKQKDTGKVIVENFDE